MGIILKKQILQSEKERLKLEKSILLLPKIVLKNLFFKITPKNITFVPFKSRTL